MRYRASVFPSESVTAMCARNPSRDASATACATIRATSSALRLGAATAGWAALARTRASDASRRLPEEVVVVKRGIVISRPVREVRTSIRIQWG